MAKRVMLQHCSCGRRYSTSELVELCEVVHQLEKKVSELEQKIVASEPDEIVDLERTVMSNRTRLNNDNVSSLHEVYECDSCLRHFSSEELVDLCDKTHNLEEQLRTRRKAHKDHISRLRREMNQRQEDVRVAREAVHTKCTHGVRTTVQGGPLQACDWYHTCSYCGHKWGEGSWGCDL